MKPQEEGRNCNLQISLITNAGIYGEQYVLSITAEPLVGHFTEQIDILKIGLGSISEEEAIKTYQTAKMVMYAVQANKNIKFLEVEKKNE